MANVQTFWNHTGAKIDPVDVRSSAFLTANAWDDIANNLGGIGKTLIEDPMSKRYLHDLNQGKDVSGYNPMVLSQEVLEKTPTIMGQLVSNNKNKLDYNVALAKENDIKANSDLYNKAMSAYARGDDATAKQLLSEYANRSMRADVSKEFMPDIFNHEMDKERIAIARLTAAQAGEANSLNRQRYNDELRRRELENRAYILYNKNSSNVFPVVNDLLEHGSRYGNGLTPEERTYVARLIGGYAGNLGQQSSAGLTPDTNETKKSGLPW